VGGELPGVYPLFGGRVERVVYAPRREGVDVVGAMETGSGVA